MNAANEQAVQAFLQHRLPYLAIIDVVRVTLDQMDTQLKEQGWCQEVEQIFELERDARRIADSLLVRAES
jgi:1-deoxy-D-xylulose-5-phosphate reductoisomerase